MAVEHAQRLQIRSLTAEDLDEVCRIEVETFPCPWSRDTFLQEMAQYPYCSSFAVTLGDRFVGFAILWILYEQAHLLNIALDRSFRGRGYGEYFLRHLLRYSRQMGADFIHLEVREDNEAAIGLYRKYGFEILGRQENYYSDGIGALLMNAKLGDNEKP